MELTATALWLNTAFAGFDQGVTAVVHKLYEAAGGFFTPIMEVISLMGKGGIFLIILSLILAFLKKTRRFGTAMCLGLAIGAIFVNLFLKRFNQILPWEQKHYFPFGYQILRHQIIYVFYSFYQHKRFAAASCHPETGAINAVLRIIAALFIFFFQIITVAIMSIQGRGNFL